MPRTSLATFLVLGLANACASGDVMIDRNAFKNNTGKVESGFRLFIAGTLIGKPKSDRMPNVETADGKPFTGNNAVDFGGGSVAAGEAINVSFEAAGKNVNPQGYFTPDGSPKSPIASIAPNGTRVTFVPSASGGGYDATIDIVNDDFGALFGSLAVHVNSGFADHFNLDDFDTLRDARTVFTQPEFSFGRGRGITGIVAHLDSADQYILIKGTADGDGSGPHPFALAFSPADAPAPPRPNGMRCGGEPPDSCSAGTLEEPYPGRGPPCLVAGRSSSSMP